MSKKVSGAQPVFKFNRTPRPDRPRRSTGPTPGEAAEHLDVQVQGKRASDIEERLARAMNQSEGVEGYRFQVSYFAGHNLPGEYRLDFLVEADGQEFAVNPDGEFAHKSAEQKARDRLQDERLSDQLAGDLAAPPAHWPSLGIGVNGLVARIPGGLLDDQPAANQLVREMFG